MQNAECFVLLYKKHGLNLCNVTPKYEQKMSQIKTTTLTHARVTKNSLDRFLKMV